MENGEKQKYLGEYRYGAAEGEILLMDKTEKKQLKLARKGVFGSVLRKVDDNTFSPAGAALVKIIFQMKDDRRLYSLYMNLNHWWLL